MSTIEQFCALEAALAAFFAAGYIMGRLDLLVATFRDKQAALPTGFFQKNKPGTVNETGQSKAKVADIDTSKFVAPISTAGMERTDTAALGKTTTTEDDIQASVSKLAQLKGR